MRNISASAIIKEVTSLSWITCTLTLSNQNMSVAVPDQGKLLEFFETAFCIGDVSTKQVWAGSYASSALFHGQAGKVPQVTSQGLTTQPRGC